MIHTCFVKETQNERSPSQLFNFTTPPSHNLRQHEWGSQTGLDPYGQTKEV